MEKLLRIVSGLFLLAFGLVSLFMTISIFFDLFGIRQKEGNYVLFVVWANFICALIYLIASYGFLKRKLWTPVMLGMAFAILVVAFIFLFIHIMMGGIYENKTVLAMTFRTTITFVLFWLSYRLLKKKA